MLARGLALGLIVVAMAATSFADTDSLNWDPGFGTPGVSVAGSGSGVVYAMLPWNNGIVVGGNFNHVNSNGLAPITSRYAAFWNGSSWTALNGASAEGGLPGPARCFAVWGGELYAGGCFDWSDGWVTTPGGEEMYHQLHMPTILAKWNGLNWLQVGGESYGTTQALAVYQNQLYAGGVIGFLHEGDVWANNIARWTGTTWQHVGNGVAGGSPALSVGVNGLAVYGADLYVGGLFQATRNSGITPVAGTYAIARWNGSAFSSVGGGFQPPAAGSETWDRATSSAPQPKSSAVLTNTQVTPAQEYDDYYINALATSAAGLYVGGNFAATAAGLPTRNAALWNGSWNLLGVGTDSAVKALAVSGATVYVGGSFTHAGGITAPHVARWSGGAWAPVGAGTAGGFTWHVEAIAIATASTPVYVGGSFTAVQDYAGGPLIPAFGIARWMP